jgi:threonine/homoserine/homoserine lactone efflux protein
MSAGALAAIFGTSFIVSLTGALSPGPLTTMAVREGVRRGAWAGPVLAAGHGLIELVLVVGLALGLREVLDRDAVTAVIALAGGGFLVWLGVWTVVLAPGMNVPAAHGAAAGESGARDARPPARVVGLLGLAGIAVTVTNPYWVAWWATIGAAYIVESLEHGVAGLAAFYSAHILTDIGWLTLIAFAVAGGRRLMTRRVYQGVLIVCGVFLVVLGGWFLSTGVGYLV